MAVIWAPTYYVEDSKWNAYIHRCIGLVPSNSPSHLSLSSSVFRVLLIAFPRRLRHSTQSFSSSSMAPPNRLTSHSSNSSRRPSAQPSTACTPPTMSPALCRAPRMPLVPLPQVNGHVSYPTASAPPPAIRDGQWQRDNALQLTGMPLPTGMLPPFL